MVKVPADCVLRFSDAEIKKFKWDTRDDAEAFSSLVDDFGHLLELDLTGTSVGIEAAHRLADALRRHPELIHAVFQDMFKSRMKNEIPPALKVLCEAMQEAGCELRRFDISDNAMGPVGAEGFKQFLRSPTCYTLEDLGLNNLGLGISGGKEVTDALMDCHRSSNDAGTPLKLKKIVVGRNRQEGPGAIAFARVFKAVGSMESVTMHQNGITPDGIEALADALLHSPNIRVINLSDNTCKAQGARALAKVIRKQRGIEEIVLEDCLLKNAGTRALIKALEQPNSARKLKRLSLNGNEIGSVVAMQLIECLKLKPVFEELSLAENCFGGSFPDVEKKARSANFDVGLGSAEDDQGSASESESDDEQELDGEDVSDNDDDIVVVEDEMTNLVEKHNVTCEDIRDRHHALEAIHKFIDAGSQATYTFDCSVARKLAGFMVKLCTDIHVDDDDKHEKLDAVSDCCEDILHTLHEHRGVYFGVVSSPPSSQLLDFICSELAFLNKTCAQSSSRPVDLYGPLLVMAELVHRQAFSEAQLATLKFWITELVDSAATSGRCAGEGTKKALDEFNDALMNTLISS